MVNSEDESVFFSVPRIGTEKNLEIKIKFGTSVICIGANGSGKTRLSVFLENNFSKENILRLVAQRSISLPEKVAMKREIEALKDRDCARDKAYLLNPFVKTNRYKGKPAIYPISDYEYLLQFLFAEQGNVANNFLNACKDADKKGEQRPNTPQSKLEKVIEIWQEVLPHRRLKPGDWSLKTYNEKEENTEYSSSEMSDGEREIFYLIGQCITARQKSLIIVDEPELHLNPSIVNCLWEEIEKSRPDCAFLYITHDANFVATHSVSQKFALYGYVPKPTEKWDIEELPEESELPEKLLVEIIGSRKKILLVEGEKNSWDNLIYSAVYPAWHVISVGSCNHLEYYIKTLRDRRVSCFHHQDFKGLIDRDRRSEEEVQKLQEKGIEVLDFMDIENLFLCKDVFQEIGKSLHFEAEIEDKWEILQCKLLVKMEEQRENLAFDLCKKKSRPEFEKIFLEKDVSKWGDALGNIDFEKIKNDYSHKIKTAIEDKDYRFLIERCDMKKGMLHEVAELFDKNKKQFQDDIERILRKPHSDKIRFDIVEAFRKYLPKLD